MYIVYYTDKEGKIVSHHKMANSMTPEELEEAVRLYNQNPKYEKTAHIFDAEDSGLTAYLFQKAEKRKQWDKQIVQDAIDSLEEALDFVRSLILITD